MTQNNRFKQILLGLICLGISSLTYAQADTLQVNRRVLGVKYSVYSVPLEPKYARKVLYREKESRPLFHKANIMTGVAVASVGAGAYLVTDALIGVPAFETTPDGREIPYTIRSQTKFVGGILMCLAAGCLSQYAMDLKVKAVRQYNAKEMSRATAEIGYLSGQRIGFRINLP